MSADAAGRPMLPPPGPCDDGPCVPGLVCPRARFLHPVPTREELSCVVVDNHPGMAGVLSRWAKRAGARDVATASSVASALAVLGCIGARCVVLDVRLDDGTGFDVLGALRDFGHPGPAPRVLAMSAELSPELSARLLRAGAEHCMDKVSSRADVVPLIAAMLDPCAAADATCADSPQQTSSGHVSSAEGDADGL